MTCLISKITGDLGPILYNSLSLLFLISMSGKYISASQVGMKIKIELDDVRMCLKHSTGKLVNTHYLAKIQSVILGTEALVPRSVYRVNS